VEKKAVNVGSILVPQLPHRPLPSLEEDLLGCKGCNHMLSISKRRICWKEHRPETWVMFAPKHPVES